MSKKPRMPTSERHALELKFAEEKYRLKLERKQKEAEIAKSVIEAKQNIKASVKAEKEAADLAKKLLLDELEQTWKTCDKYLFQNVCEIDYRKAYFYLAERLMRENKFLTFEDNLEIIVYENSEGVYAQNAHLFIAERVKAILDDKAMDFAVKEITNSIRRSTYFDRQKIFEQPNHYKPFKNGLFNLLTRKLEPFTSELIFFDKIDIDFIETADCPKFKKFLAEIVETEKPSCVLVIQEWLGYCLLNDNRFQKALLLYGSGGNGKSVLLKVVERFLGGKNVAKISLQHLEKNNFAVARLFGKSANIFMDLPPQALAQTSNFKAIVTGDPVGAEKKGKDGFDYTPYCKMMFSCNEVPRTPDRTDAFFDRWIVLKFPHDFRNSDQRIEKLEEQFYAEMQGILNFALEGLYRLLEKKNFTQSLSKAEIKDFWLRHSDSIVAFGLDMIAVDAGAEEEKAIIFSSYESYCNQQNYNLEEPNSFWRRFKEIFVCKEYQPSKGSGQIRAIKGVRLRALPVENRGNNQ